MGTSNARNKNLRPLFKTNIPPISGKYGLRNHFWSLESGFLMRKREENDFFSKSAQIPILSFWILNGYIIICQFQKRSTVKHFLSLTPCSCHLCLVSKNLLGKVDQVEQSCRQQALTRKAGWEENAKVGDIDRDLVTKKSEKTAAHIEPRVEEGRGRAEHRGGPAGEVAHAQHQPSRLCHQGLRLPFSSPGQEKGQAECHVLVYFLYYVLNR